MYAEVKDIRTSADLSLKNSAFRTQIAKLAAPIQGRSLEEIFGEEVRQRRIWNAVLTCIILFLLSAAIFANQERQKADTSAEAERKATIVAQAQRRIAEQKTRDAEQAAKAEQEATKVAQEQTMKAVQAAKAEGLAKNAEKQQRLIAEKRQRQAEDQRKIAEKNEKEAQEQKRVAIARQLVVHADALRAAGNPQLSLLLATDSLIRRPSLEANQVLRADLWVSPVLRMSLHHKGYPEFFNVRASDGRLITTTYNDVYIWHRGDDDKLVLEETFTTQGKIIRLSDDAEWVLTEDRGSKNELARVHSTKSHELKASIRPPDKEFFCCGSVAFENKGRYVAIGIDARVGVWDIASGEHIMLVKADDFPSSLSFSPDSEFLVTAPGDGRGSVQVWSVPDGREILKIEGQAPARFSPDGRYLVVTVQGAAAMWDLSDRVLVKRFPHLHGVTEIVFAPHGPYIATGSRDSIRVWNFPAGNEVALINQAVSSSRDSHNLQFSPSGGHLSAVTSGYLVRAWRIPTGTIEAEIPYSGFFAPTIRFISDSELTIADFDTTARVWVLPPRISAGEIRHSNLIREARLNTKGIAIATASLDGTARVWAVPDGQELLKVQHEGGVTDVHMSSDNAYVATSSMDRSVRVWSAETGKEIHRFSFHRPEAVRFSPDSKYLAIGRWDGATLFRCGSWERILDLPGSFVEDVEFSPTGKYIAVVGGPVTVWRLSDGEKVASIPWRPYRRLAFSQDENYIVTSSSDAAYLYSLPNGRELAVMRQENKDDRDNRGDKDHLFDLGNL